MVDMWRSRNADGRFCSDAGADDPTIQIALAKNLLRKALNSPFDGKGAPKDVTREELAWATQVIAQKPEWALPVLRECGFPC
jgi:hypothetical protein